MCYTETGDRNRIRNEYKQQVVSISNVNLVYAGPGGRVV
jgi:hypothetical protein